jgi:uncharacterized membrane protein YgcG
MTARGVTVAPSRGAGWAFDATPRGFGCDGDLAATGGAAPADRGGRVEYARAGLREWYADGPRGLEQGFTIPAPPACRRRGGRGVAIALGGGLSAVVSEDRRGARLYDAAGREVLRYTDLRVIDAAGRELPAALAAAGRGLTIRFDDTGAAYPVEVDPMMWAQQQVLTPANAVMGDAFGTAVSVSGDTAVVGAPGSNAGNGSAVVFLRSGTTWSLQQELVASDDAQGSELGNAVSVSGDTAIVGAPQMVDGAAYVYVRSGSAWTQQQKIVSPSPNDGARFGTSVAVQGDTAIIGAPFMADGAACVYVRSGGVWTLQQVLTGTPVPDGGGIAPAFGNSVALDGDAAIVGAPDDANGFGAAYVFVRSGTTWTLEQQIPSPNAPFAESFAVSVAIAGGTALVGMGEMPGGGAYAFTRAGTTWTLAQEIQPPDGSLGTFGRTVALSSSAAVVGATLGDGSDAVVAYVAGAAGLASPQVLATQDMASGPVVNSVALDGATVVLGAPSTQAGAGEAFVFAFGTPVGDPCASGADCLSGHCVDGVCCTTATCPGADTCHSAETCQAGTGTCSVTPIHEGMACDAGLCTTSAVCHGGTCTGEVNVCAPPDDCHEFGSCDPGSGKCINPAKPDGQPCPGGTCEGGACTGSGGKGGGGSAAGSGGGGSGGGGSSGCGCGVGGAPPSGALLVACALLLLARRRLRPRASRR